ncbi:unnamed protein product [Lymnaea stagnalis]|uniref:Uncharacterized protein n=1 Tax=Lymnaea stagnalis TaxID=6523 RepID=A0AAV2IL33_LYMST
MSQEMINLNILSANRDNTDVRIQSSYIPIDKNFKILRAGHHQGDRNIFDGRYCGFQCCAMALAIILRSSILPISDWTSDVVTQSMLAAHRFYAMVLYLQYVFQNPELLERAQDIFCYDLPGRYLRVQDFDVVKNCVSLFEKSFTLSYEAESPLFGTLMDNSNSKSPVEGPGKTLLDSLHQLFTFHNAGIFIAGGKSLAVISHGDKFYLFDSHSCGPVGEPTLDGKACVIQVETLSALANCCKRSAVDERLTYTVDHVDVTVCRDSPATK